MPRRKIDVRPIIGAAVVFLIIGTIIFCAVYFLILKPAAERLEQSKLSALAQLSTLSDFGTSQALSDAALFTSRIEEASSRTEIQAILTEVDAAVEREEKRQDLMRLAATVVEGAYYSATGGGGKIKSQYLVDLKSTLDNEILGKTTLSDLTDYESVLHTKATSAWRTLHTDAINAISGERVSFAKSNSIPYTEFKSKENALAYVELYDWRTLSKVIFEEATVLVPVLDTFKRTPTIRENANVVVYYYDKTAENLQCLVGGEGAKVVHVIYSQADISVISWTLSSLVPPATEVTKWEYSADVWETLKAAVAGSASAADIVLENYGEALMDSALQANVGDYTVSVIYMLEVSERAAEVIVPSEFHQTGKSDIILIPRVPAS